jgi:hypothetical protein
MLYHYKTNSIFIAFKKQLRVFYVDKTQLSTANIKENNKNTNSNTNAHSSQPQI